MKQDLTFREQIWVTQNLEAVKVKDMTYTHIVNTLNMLNDTIATMKCTITNCFVKNDIYYDNLLEYQNWVKIFEKELKYREEQIKKREIYD